MTDSTYDFDLGSPITAIINLIVYNSVMLDVAKRIGVFDIGLIASSLANYDINPAHKDDSDALIPRPTYVRPVLPAGANAAGVAMIIIVILQ